MELQVLVATMGQKDLTLADKMNLRQNAVIANQCGAWGFEARSSEFGTIQMLSSDTKGVGINRNLALQLAKADILLFADDDIRYYHSDLQGVIDAFRQLPDADMIFFGMDMTRDGQIYEKRRSGIKRIHFWNFMRYGACRMAIRRSAVVKNKLSFSTLFGGGCIYGSGEDTLFIRDCLKKGLRLYVHSYVLGACAKDTSSWFDGFNEKYFYDKGAMLACGFPVGKHLMKWYFALKFMRKSGKSITQVLKHMNRGIRGFGALEPYRKE